MPRLSPSCRSREGDHASARFCGNSRDGARVSAETSCDGARGSQVARAGWRLRRRFEFAGRRRGTWIPLRPRRDLDEVGNGIRARGLWRTRRGYMVAATTVPGASGPAVIPTPSGAGPEGHGGPGSWPPRPHRRVPTAPSVTSRDQSCGDGKVIGTEARGLPRSYGFFAGRVRRLHGAPGGAVGDERGEALGARVFALGADDPVRGGALVPRWLGGEERGSSWDSPSARATPPRTTWRPPPARMSRRPFRCGGALSRTPLHRRAASFPAFRSVLDLRETLIALQMLVGFRGVKRIVRRPRPRSCARRRSSRSTGPRPPTRAR